MTTNTKNTKKPGGGLITMGAIVLMVVLSNSDEFSGEALAIAIGASCLFIFVGFISNSKAGKGSASSATGTATSAPRTATPVYHAPLKGPDHNHDRISNPGAYARETPAEHYKRQLDGFLKAGIIEKEEYRELMKRHGMR